MNNIEATTIKDLAMRAQRLISENTLVPYMKSRQRNGRDELITGEDALWVEEVYDLMVELSRLTPGSR